MGKQELYVIHKEIVEGVIENERNDDEDDASENHFVGRDAQDDSKPTETGKQPACLGGFFYTVGNALPSGAL